MHAIPGFDDSSTKISPYRIVISSLTHRYSPGSSAFTFIGTQSQSQTYVHCTSSKSNVENLTGTWAQAYWFVGFSSGDDSFQNIDRCKMNEWLCHELNCCWVWYMLNVDTSIVYDCNNSIEFGLKQNL